MKKIILATKNSHKTKEFKSIFKNILEIEDLKDLNFNDEIIEDGKTFIENSIIKCKKIYEKYNTPVLADDSGLCVKALGGEPGIYSARFGGEGLTDNDRYELLLNKMTNVTDREASFVCALVLYFNPNKIFVIQEECKGKITLSPSGENGFGYDPVFFVEEYNKVMADLSDEEKNSISHRGKATREMLKLLTGLV